jgi:recombination protein RecR
MDGIGPQALNIASLPVRIEKDQPKEIILALSPTMEGDTTNFYIFKKIKAYDLLVTRISRGIAVGSELQYADELTLGRSLQQRQIFDLQQ